MMKYIFMTLFLITSAFAQTQPSMPSFLLDLDADVAAKRSAFEALRTAQRSLPPVGNEEALEQLRQAREDLVRAQEELQSEYRRCQRQWERSPGTRCIRIERIEPRPVVMIEPGPAPVPAVSLDTLTEQTTLALTSVQQPLSSSSTSEVLSVRPGQFDASTCVWADEIPRKIISAPSNCSRASVKVCTGYVICNRTDDSGGKFFRLSTCSAANCADGKAAACTRERGYSSATPSGVEEIKDSTVNVISSGSSGQ